MMPELVLLLALTGAVLSGISVLMVLFNQMLRLLDKQRLEIQYTLTEPEKPKNDFVTADGDVLEVIEDEATTKQKRGDE